MGEGEHKATKHAWEAVRVVVRTCACACVATCALPPTRTSPPAHRMRPTAAGKVTAATAQSGGEIAIIIDRPPVTIIRPRTAPTVSVVRSFCSDEVSEERRESSSPVSVVSKKPVSCGARSPLAVHEQCIHV